MTPGIFPAGRFWCPRCFQTQDFILALDENGATPEAAEPPLECYACGYVHGKIREEFDPKTGLPHPVPVERSAIPRAVRDAARAHLRDEFRETMLRDGVRLENFTRRKG